MTHRVRLQFERTATITERGGVSIDVSSGDSYETVYSKAFKEKFAEFLVTDRSYEDVDWEFTIMKDSDDDENS